MAASGAGKPPQNDVKWVTRLPCAFNRSISDMAER